MGLFVTSPPSTAGAFAQERTAPATVAPVGTGTAVIVGQFPWGPAESLTYPSSFGAAVQQFAPAGMDHTNSAYLSIIRKSWPRLGIVRAWDTTAVAATVTITKTGPTNLFTLTAIAIGTAGNSLIANIANADDGNANHFNLTVSVTGASGTTVEKYPNLNLSGTGADVLPSFTNSVLVATFTKLTSGVPLTGNTTFSGGTDGTIASTAYVGTPGAGDKGFALLENDNTIEHLFVDDPGNTLRAAVNAGLLAHVVLTSNKIGYINGNSGQSASSAQTDVATYRDPRMVYVDPWAYILDDINGTQRLAPSACWAASVAAQIPPSLDIAFRDPSVTGLLAGINAVEFDRGSSRGQNNAAGITTLIKGFNGGFAFEEGLNTSAIAGQTLLTRSRMGIYIGKSVTIAWQPFVNAPNVALYQQDLVNSLDVFLGTLKKNATLNPAALPYIGDYQILTPDASNTAATIAAGQFTVAANIQTGASMQQIFLSLQYGPGVQLTVQ